jgi:Carboxypeptidase regulatory-like domain
MTPQSRSKVLALAVCALLTAPLFAAPKRRAANHPTTGNPALATIKGSVVDATTNLPVANVTVTAGDHTAKTDAQGLFTLLDVPHNGGLAVTAARSGYNPGTQNITGGGTHNLTYRLTPRPTVTVRKTNGQTVVVDHEELKFGYVILFVGYAAFEYDDFCMPDGSRVRINVSDIKRVLGPAVKVTHEPCCASPIQRVRLELRNGTNTDAYFRDSCFDNTVDIVARNHATGDIVYLPFSEIAEVVFP